MNLEFFLKGAVVGFSIAAPVGPIGLLCIERTLSRGRMAGLVSGLGAASADAVYGSIAGFGLTMVAEWLTARALLLQAAGGVFLCLLGVTTFLRRPAAGPAGQSGKGLAAAYGSTFVLTLTNPITILAFAAIYAGLGLAGSGGDTLAATALVGGVFLGSGLWWLVLSGTVGLLREHMNPHRLRWVNRVSGLILAGAGIASLLGMLRAM